MHPNQCHVDADIVANLIAEQFPAYRHHVVERIMSAGTDNAMFRVGPSLVGRLALRSADPVAHHDNLRREAEAMKELTLRAPVATPQVIGIGRPGFGYPLPWMLQTWIEGDIPTPDGLEKSAVFATDVANLIASLRATETRGRIFSGKGRGGNLPDHDAWMAECFDRSEGLLEVPRLGAVWARLRALPAGGPDVMSHSDLIPANLLARDGKLVGVLDCGGFAPADPALDLVAAWHLFDRRRRDIIRARLLSDNVQWRRGAAWAFQQAMGLVWYYRETNPAMSELGRSTLSRILADPDI